MTTPVITTTRGWVNRLRDWIPARYREQFYRYASAVSALLLALGITNQDQAALWGQLAVGVVTTLFALLYATSNWRVAFYGVLGPLGGLLMTYGIVSGSRWALIVAAVGQVFGITTAAAKADPPSPAPYAVLAPTASQSDRETVPPAPPDSTV